jgi:TctA family transporter
MNKTRLTVLAGMILAAAAFRILPHPPNFSPIAAIALLGGSQFADKRLAFLVPLTAMLLGDLVLGLHALMPVVYGCFGIIVCLGFWLRRRRNAPRIVVAALASSVLFYLLTNFAVWASTNLYPKTIAGLTACYVAAIPFFWNTLAGDCLFTAVLFGGLALAEWRLPRLREGCPA